LLNGKSVTRHISDLVSTRANLRCAKVQNIDPFQLPSVADIILPSEVNSDFHANLPRFHNDVVDDDNIEDVLDLSNDKNKLLPLITPPGAGSSDSIVPTVPIVPDVADEDREEHGVAEQLQQSMNAVEHVPVVPQNDHSGFNLSWQKPAHYNRAKVKDDRGLRGRGRGQRHQGVTRGGAGTTGGDKVETALSRGGDDDQRGQTEDAVKQGVGVRAVRKGDSDDSDWVRPAWRIKVLDSEGSDSQRLLRSSARLKVLREALPEGGDEERGGQALAGEGENGVSPADLGTEVIVNTGGEEKEKEEAKRLKEVKEEIDKIREKCDKGGEEEEEGSQGGLVHP